MHFDIIIIGAGISGLTAASLLSKRGLKVAVIDKSYNPGGSCGIFKRDNAIFDQGSAMLFGFGDKGFNPHRFVFNCLEEPIDVIKHNILYCINYMGKRIKFLADIDEFSKELAEVFPKEKENIKRFYSDLNILYHNVMVEHPAFSTPDEMDSKNSFKGVIKHPVSYAKFLGYMNKSTKSLLLKYFSDPEIFKFFDKLTSTYCYTSVRETPAILAAIMFIDNHVGGSYYPAGSTIFLPGKLEKVIEEQGGEMLLEKEVVRILFNNGEPSGVELQDGEKHYADNIVYSGTVWNLYEKLIAKKFMSKSEIEWAKNLLPTWPSVVLYAIVDKDAIGEETYPIEMLIGNPDKLDESEVTVYISSIDDKTLCNEDSHTIMAIGPTFEDWATKNKAEYISKKEGERLRLLKVLEKRFPGIIKKVRYSEIATPLTIERYTNKNGGSVAGPKQMLGQHMLHRLHTKSKWNTLYFCGESTVMGTGTPAVTISGLSAANAILKKQKLEQFKYSGNMKNYVNIVKGPFKEEDLFSNYSEELRGIMQKASKCQYCEHPTCMKETNLDIRGIMRRVTVGNFIGARRLASNFTTGNEDQTQILLNCQNRCIQNFKIQKPVEIKAVVNYIASIGD